jgi:hypothetical protein
MKNTYTLPTLDFSPRTTTVIPTKAQAKRERLWALVHDVWAKLPLNTPVRIGGYVKGHTYTKTGPLTLQLVKNSMRMGDKVPLHYDDSVNRRCVAAEANRALFDLGAMGLLRLLKLARKNVLAQHSNTVMRQKTEAREWIANATKFASTIF